VNKQAPHALQRLIDFNMYILSPLSIFAILATYVMAQSEPVAPTMTLLYHMEVELGKRFSIGSVPNGQERIVIPIVGGTFKGPRLSGTTNITAH
jgi:hypothetical protein